MTGPSSWCSVAFRAAVYLRDAFTCQYCGRDLRRARRCEIGLDHLIPRSADTEHPDHSSSNLITVCRSCNSKRGDRPWRDYAPGGSQDRIEATIRQSLNMDLAEALIAGYEPGWERW